MKLNELFEQDINEVFFDFDEMAEKILIDDVETECIYIRESTNSKKGRQGLSKIDGSTLYLKHDEEVYNKYKPGKSIDIEDTTYIITNRSVEYKLIKLKLEESEGF